MKTLSIEEAKGRFQAVCEEALAGEVIRLRTADGSLLELTPVPPGQASLTEEESSQCYEDNEWAAFENRCGIMARTKLAETSFEFWDNPEDAI